MFKPVNRLFVLKCLPNEGLNFPPRTAHLFKIFRRSSELLEEKKNEELINEAEKVSCSSFLQKRQEEAKRSFLVKLPKPNDLVKILQSCSDYGSVNRAYHYKERNYNFLIVEMDSTTSLKNFFSAVFHCDSDVHCCQIMQKSVSEVNEDQMYSVDDILNDKFLGGTNILKPGVRLNKNKYLKIILSESSDLSEIIDKCYNMFRVNEVETRKRFLLCRQIEVLCRGFIPNAVAYPFGSSISGFGFNDSDLDIALVPTMSHNSLFFQPDYINFETDLVRMHLEVLSQIMIQFLVGCTDFFFVKHAKVPIVKYKSLFANLDCDLSLYNIHGIAMTHILFSIGLLDWRIRGIVLFLKLWAKKVKLVTESPSTSLSSFSLLLLVIFFLQQKKFLPPWNVFLKEEYKIFTEGLDFSQINFKFNRNSELVDKPVGEWFISFLNYYSKFDFVNSGISVRTGEIIKKKINDPIYIENPLVPSVNVSKNVKLTDSKYIKSFIHNAAKTLSTNNCEKFLQIFFLDDDSSNSSKKKLNYKRF